MKIELTTVALNGRTFALELTRDQEGDQWIPEISNPVTGEVVYTGAGLDANLNTAKVQANAFVEEFKSTSEDNPRLQPTMYVVTDGLSFDDAQFIMHHIDVEFSIFTTYVNGFQQDVFAVPLDVVGEFIGFVSEHIGNDRKVFMGKNSVPNIEL